MVSPPLSPKTTHERRTFSRQELMLNSNRRGLIRGSGETRESSCARCSAMSRLRTANLSDSYDLYVDLRESVSLKYFLLVYLLLSLLVLTAVLFALLFFVLFIRQRQPELGQFF